MFYVYCRACLVHFKIVSIGTTIISYICEIVVGDISNEIPDEVRSTSEYKRLEVQFHIFSTEMY